MEKSKQLVISNCLAECRLLVEEIRDLKRSLNLEVDLARDRRLEQERQFTEFMKELRQTLTSIQARFRIEAELLDLIKPEKAGENKWQRGEANHRSSQCNTLERYVKNTQ